MSLETRERFFTEQWAKIGFLGRKDKFFREKTDVWFADQRMQRVMKNIEESFDNFDVRSTVLISKFLFNNCN